MSEVPYLPCCDVCPLMRLKITKWDAGDVEAEPCAICSQMTHKQIVMALGHKCVYASREKRMIKRAEKSFERDYKRKAKYER